MKRVKRLIKAGYEKLAFILRKVFSKHKEMQDNFRVVALIAMRNEELYLERSLHHLIDQGIEVCIIDNESTDNSLSIAESFLSKGVFRIETYPYKGYYDWIGILKLKEQLCYEIEADWFMHQDVDEIREAPVPFANLKEAIFEVDRLGYNAINFDEFTFMPIEEHESYIGKDYVREMKHYFFYRPTKWPSHVNAWKKLNTKIDLAGKAGHRVNFPQIKLFPRNFILRHYIFLSKAHGIAKYCQRVFSPEELKKGWHAKRAALTPETFRLPSREGIKTYQEDRRWDRSEPCKDHKCFS